jgi:regulation of enolase protein 1 (concanavalin A-like superfamily)
MARISQSFPDARQYTMPAEAAMTTPIREAFAGPALQPGLSWYCEPPRWSLGGRLRLEPAAATDFWQRTHYGFEVDNGHFLFANVANDFLLEAGVRFQPVHQYDQAGLMVRISPSCWLKTSVEYEPAEAPRLGVVVTNHGFSDWSTQPFPRTAREVWLRVLRTGEDYIVHASRDGHEWEQLRMAHLHADRRGVPVQAGLYACSPKGAGFVAEFDYLHLDPR